jgi:uncharacterized protein YdiU (UPF0061 family)
MVQNGSSASVLVNAIKSESIAEMTRILEEAEDLQAESANAMEEKKLALQDKIMQNEAQQKELDREMEKYKVDMQWQIAVLQNEAKGSEQELMLKVQEHENKIAIERSKLDETKRSNMAKEEEATRHNEKLESIKPKTKV